MIAFKKLAAMSAFAAVSIGAASAHSGHGPEPGVVAGVLHYFSGIDHIAGSLAAGLLGGLLMHRRGLAILWILSCAVFFGVYHDVAFFRDLQLRSFDAGFMGAAMIVMIASFAAVDSFVHRRSAKGRAR